MTDTTAQARTGRVEFTGGRQEMLGIILRGYALMIPTIGLYRFWQATWKRRFYWQNTVIDGEPIEYTGTAGQLLLGWGLFNLVEGLLDHHLLGIHHVREVPDPLAYDLVFLGLGGLGLILVGAWLRRGPPRSDAPGAAMPSRVDS